MKAFVFQCQSGISGDMTVAALLDLGADQKVLLDGLNSLHVDGFQIEISKVKKCGIEATDFHVILNHDGHAHEHEHHHEHHHHEHRNFHDIVSIIESSDITVGAKKLAIHIFEIIAQAESKAHGLPIDQVHFHEVGAVDSIVDIVGAAICLDNLGVDLVYCNGVCEGTGTVKCQHGSMPVPVPAVLNIVSAHQIPLMITDVQGEMVTPTGAAILAGICKSFSLPEKMVVQKIGYGAGKKEFSQANVLRIMQIELSETQDEDEKVVLIESNIDDQTPEQLSYAMEQCFCNGALDVWFEPIYMKKNRPAVKFCVLCKATEQDLLCKTILKDTSAIGVRYTTLDRQVMQRTCREVTTRWGTAVVKTCIYEDIKKESVEFESAKKLAEQADVSLEEVFREIYRCLK